MVNGEDLRNFENGNFSDISRAGLIAIARYYRDGGDLLELTKGVE